MSEAPTRSESSLEGLDAVTIELERALGGSVLDLATTLPLVVKPVETEPVSWDGPDDPKNPQNWPARKKWLIIAVNGIITVNVYVFASHVLRDYKLTIVD